MISETVSTSAAIPSIKFGDAADFYLVDVVKTLYKTHFKSNNEVVY